MLLGHNVLTSLPPYTGLDPAAADVYLYGYVPQRSVAITFLVLFGLATGEIVSQAVGRFTSLRIPVAHIGQAAYYRVWWLLPTAALCGIGEIIGWSGRMWSSISPALNEPYLIQSVPALFPSHSYSHTEWTGYRPLYSRLRHFSQRISLFCRALSSNSGRCTHG